MAPQPWLSLPLIPDARVTVLKETGAQPPLFLAAPIQGSALPLVEMAQDLDRPVYGLQYPSDLPHTSISEMAAALVKVGQEMTTYRLVPFMIFSFFSGKLDFCAIHLGNKT